MGGISGTGQASGTANLLFGLSFVDTNTGVTVGAEGTILKTTDGGSHWQPQTSGTANFLFGVSFSDVNTGTAVGSGGTILRTTNGGSSWDPQTNGLRCLFTALHFGMLIQAQQLEIAVPSLEQQMAETIGDLKRATQLIICGTFRSPTQTMELLLVREAQS